MQKLLRIKAMFLLVFATTFLISGCNTVQGFGEDVEKLGGQRYTAAILFARLRA